MKYKTEILEMATIGCQHIYEGTDAMDIDDDYFFEIRDYIREQIEKMAETP